MTHSFPTRRSSDLSFRQALTDRGLLWAVGLSRRQNVYPSDVALIFPVASMGNKRKYHIPDQQPVSAETMLAKEKWKKVSWRRGTKGRLTRSEEHTSELQSLMRISYAVFCLKKKKQTNTETILPDQT